MARPPRPLTPPVTAEYFQLAQKGLMAAAGGNSVNTVFLYHFRRTAGTTTPSKSSINTRFEATIGAAVAAALNARWAATVNSIRRLNDALDANVDFSSALVGAISGDSMPSDQAAYIFCRTGVRYYFGGKHYGPMSESDSTTTSDVFNSACLARLATIATALLAGFTDADGNVWASSILATKDSVLSTNPVTIIANDVTQALVNHRVGSMNRRKVSSVY
jgi:hypothetical protein